MRHLLILRCGEKSIHRSWINRVRDRMDMAFVYYDHANFADDRPTYEDYIEGTKLTGVHDFLKKYPDLIEQYDYFWLAEDDLYLPYKSIVGIIDFIDQFRPVLCAPSLTADSYITHPITLKNNKLFLHGTDFVECMIPIMHRSFLSKTLSQFIEFPVWGIERYWQYLLWEFKEIAFIFDQWPIVHTRPVQSGSLYKTAANMAINLPADDQRAYNLYGQKFGRFINTLFGVTNDFDSKMLTGHLLREKMKYGMEDIEHFHGEKATADIYMRTLYMNDLFTQFLSFPTVQKLLRMPYITANESNIIVRDWSFGNLSENKIWCKFMKFDPSGKVIGYDQNNEHAWKMVNGKFAFFSREGEMTNLYENVSYNNGCLEMTGYHKGDPNNIHFLKEI